MGEEIKGKGKKERRIKGGGKRKSGGNERIWLDHKA